jgi:hypothetical protein
MKYYNLRNKYRIQPYRRCKQHIVYNAFIFTCTSCRYNSYNKQDVLYHYSKFHAPKIYLNRRKVYPGRSIGERTITKQLSKQNIVFFMEKTFNMLRGIGGGLLRYDVYIPKQNSINNSLLIEYDGEFHYGPIKGKTTISDWERQVKHDSMKDIYAVVNDIPLLRISYRDKKQMIYILNKYLIEYMH